MHVRELAVVDAYEFVPRNFPDQRGLFVAPLQEPSFRDAVGHPLTVAQTNHSVSRKGTIRGIHFAATPPGQAKYVYCPSGSLLDVVVDLRVGSPTFGTWDAVRLDSTEFHAVYVPEGVGHGFIALEDDTAMSYLCSTGYNPAGEFGINPLDAELGLPWPAELEFLLSEKDTAAPTLAEAREKGLLPSYDDCLARYAELRSQG
ncbi:dTDP-4-dehydrorhamnose 3,5-epimerase family protein [Prauserella cavernicola]|uniref:dTDP-4-dehydrorhamnose 3,5-epimerase family protein n=1 Tax=Prauserella cavernicola TaxID=2800127 RepID=A0A934QT32_9PSEU|nr:dTDP-4-dehydrorhamnose 3,5-epimerase [Prauserella cavernicola]MBK1785748.1 dTDP-4-dehydrorhamnose 3,5-epimerase family protein [Prauserella cavernicola]